MPTKKAVQEVADNLDVVEEVVDKAIDGVNAVDHASHVAAVATKRGLRTLKSPKSVIIMLGVSGVVVGASLGVGAYFLLKKRLEKQYEAQLEREIEEVRASYKRRFKREQQFATPEAAAEAVKLYSEGEKSARRNPLASVRDTDVIRGKGGEPGYIEDAEEVEVEENVFLNGKAINPFEWNQEVEESKRDTESPYVISFEEYNENANDWEQGGLTYYEGDDVLADEADNPIPEIEATVGYDNLNRFGQGSGDKNVVYIRNERIQSDFEIIHSPSKFVEHVTGLQHSDEPRRRHKQRWGDDE